MPLINRTVALAVAAAALTGCGGLTPGQQIAEVFKPPPPPTETYQLTKGEKALDCKKLTGRMQVRILQIRDFEERETQSFVSRGVQAAAHPVLGTNTTGGDPTGQVSRDRAKLRAYNQQLIAKGCKSFNLDAELKPKPVTVTPTPSAQPAGNKSQQ